MRALWMVIAAGMVLNTTAGTARADDAADLAKAETMSTHDLYEYQQTCYQQTDPVGDLALLRRTQVMAGILIDVMEHKTAMNNENATKPADQCAIAPSECATLGTASTAPAPKSDAEIEREVRAKGLPELETRQEIASEENAQLSFDGDQNPLRRDGFNRMFAEIINEERKNGIKPTYGKPQNWSPVFQQKYMRDPITGFSKLLVALASGHTDTYMVTGEETPLLTWALSQPEQSITFDSLFRESYRLNNGNVYKTLLAIENILSVHWRSPDREEFPLTKRLKPIASGYGAPFEVYGTWYHLFGIMLYGYVYGPNDAWFIGQIETAGAKIISERGPQKTFMNSNGGKIGADLRNTLVDKSYLKVPMNPAALEETAYLDHTEDFRDRIHVADNPEFDGSQLYRDPSKQNAPIESVEVFNHGKDLKNCSIDLFVITKHSDQPGSATSQKIEYPPTDIPAGRETDIFIHQNGDSVRGFVHDCEGTQGQMIFDAK